MNTAPIVVSGLDHALLALLVDRDADTRHMYSEFLRQAACEIDEAEDGRQALAKAITRHPDIIVTETRLPGISGYDLCRLLREDDTTRDISIVVVTADAFVQDRSRARAAGADAVLVKPCLPEDLATTIRRVVEQSREVRARANRVREALAGSLERANDALDHSQATLQKRVMLSRTHNRHDTTEPPIAPPGLLCPACDQPLKYIKSHIGGVSERHQEQWDYFECAAGCGTFQYRQRTRKLRRVM